MLSFVHMFTIILASRYTVYHCQCEYMKTHKHKGKSQYITKPYNMITRPSHIHVILGNRKKPKYIMQSIEHVEIIHGVLMWYITLCFKNIPSANVGAFVYVSITIYLNQR